MARDILYENGDIAIENGDWKIGFSDEQHIEDILVASKGDYKQHPFIGVNIRSYLNSPLNEVTKLKLLKEITLQLESDNANDVDAKYVHDKLNISATYE